MRSCWMLMCALLGGCATLHHVQIGEIDNRDYNDVRRFEISLTQTNADVDEIVHHLSHFGADLLAYTSMGPRTGTAGGIEGISGDLLDRLLEACPNGHITGITSTRESTNVGFAGNETVRVSGFCIGE